MPKERKRSSFSNEIDIMITHALNQQPAPMRAVVRKIHSNDTISITTSNGILNYVEYVGGEPVIGESCLLIYLNGEFTDYMAIC